jgi:hypothetical protein
LEIASKLEEKEKIDEILELSNERIAIKNEKELKIYSLNTLKLITKIDNISKSDSYIELENKDLVRKSDSYIHFFKLKRKEYQLFQTIDEKEKINCFIKLMNGNLLFTCNNKSINIYGKEENKYKLISQNSSENNCIDAIEIEDNKIVIFKGGYKFQIFLYDILNQSKIILMNDFQESGRFGKSYLNMIKNGKYLIVNFEIYDINYNAYNIARSITGPTYYPMVGYVFNLGKENYLKCEYDNFPDKSGKILIAKAFNCKINTLKIISNYNNNTLIAI